MYNRSTKPNQTKSKTTPKKNKIWILSRDKYSMIGTPNIIIFIIIHTIYDGNAYIHTYNVIVCGTLKITGSCVCVCVCLGAPIIRLDQKQKEKFFHCFFLLFFLVSSYARTRSSDRSMIEVNEKKIFIWKWMDGNHKHTHTHTQRERISLLNEMMGMVIGARKKTMNQLCH